jgi:glutamate/tyrosine decarboxylase-like PLP-dependent enzyme
VGSGGSQMLVLTRFGRKVSITRLVTILFAVEACWHSKNVHSSASDRDCAVAHRCIATVCARTAGDEDPDCVRTAIDRELAKGAAPMHHAPGQDAAVLKVQQGDGYKQGGEAAAYMPAASVSLHLLHVAVAPCALPWPAPPPTLRHRPRYRCC